MVTLSTKEKLENERESERDVSEIVNLLTSLRNDAMRAERERDEVLALLRECLPHVAHVETLHGVIAEIVGQMGLPLNVITALTPCFERGYLNGANG